MTLGEAYLNNKFWNQHESNSSYCHLYKFIGNFSLGIIPWNSFGDISPEIVFFI